MLVSCHCCVQAVLQKFKFVDKKCTDLWGHKSFNLDLCSFFWLSRANYRLGGILRSPWFILQIKSLCCDTNEALWRRKWWFVIKKKCFRLCNLTSWLCSWLCQDVLACMFTDGVKHLFLGNGWIWVSQVSINWLWSGVLYLCISKMLQKRGLSVLEIEWDFHIYLKVVCDCILCVHVKDIIEHHHLNSHRGSVSK